jgi:hypothetical protein
MLAMQQTAVSELSLSPSRHLSRRNLIRSQAAQSSEQQGTIRLKGITDLEIKSGLSILKSSVDGYPSGAIALAFKGADDEGVAVGLLDGVFAPLGIKVNTNYDPNDKPCKEGWAGPYCSFVAVKAK